MLSTKQKSDAVTELLESGVVYLASEEAADQVRSQASHPRLTISSPEPVDIGSEAMWKLTKRGPADRGPSRDVRLRAVHVCSQPHVVTVLELRGSMDLLQVAVDTLAGGDRMASVEVEECPGCGWDLSTARVDTLVRRCRIDRPPLRSGGDRE